MKKLGGAVTVAAFVVLLAGCSSPSTEVAPSPSETSSPTTSTTSPLEALRRSYIEAGGQCVSFSTRDTAVAESATDCDDGALLTTYSSGTQLDAAIRVLQRLQDTNPSPHVIAVGSNWIVNGGAAQDVAAAMGGRTQQIGTPAPSTTRDLRTDEGLCAADAEMTNLQLNDAIAVILGYPGDRDARSYEQAAAIRDYKSAAFERACPARAS